MQEAETVNLEQMIQLARNGSIPSMPEMLEKLHLQLDLAELSDSIKLKKHVEEVSVLGSIVLLIESSNFNIILLCYR